MHSCPWCGQACDCDGEDTWIDWPCNLDCRCGCADDEDVPADAAPPRFHRLTSQERGVFLQEQFAYHYLPTTFAKIRRQHGT